MTGNPSEAGPSEPGPSEAGPSEPDQSEVRTEARSEAEVGPPEATLSDASDTVLVLAIGRWNEDALAEAFRRHSGSVFAVANQVLRDEGAAREITHDAFVQLWYRPESYDPERGTLRAFLLNFSHSRAIDRLRASPAARETRRAPKPGPTRRPNTTSSTK